MNQGEFQRSVAHFFDGIVDQLDAEYRDSYFFAQRYSAFDRIVEQFSSPDGSAIDYGCGSGALTHLLVGRFERVVATDISACMLRHTEQTFAEEPSVSVIDTAKLDKESFDLILCSSVIEYVEEPRKFLIELRSHLNEGGVLLASLPNHMGAMQLYHSVAGRKKKFYIGYQKHRFSKRSVHRLMSDSGFCVLDLCCPVGLPLLRAVGLGELFVCVALASS